MRKESKLSLSFLLTLICVMGMLLSACGGGGNNAASGEKAPANKQVLRQANPVADLGSLDPAVESDAPSSAAVGLAFVGLVSLDNNMNIQPELAQSWDTSADGLTWTFHLRPGLKFSNGDPLTSKDVAYTFDRALEPATKSQTGPAYLILIKGASELNSGKGKTIIGDGIKTPDDNTVAITLTQKAAYFLQTLTYDPSWIVNKKIVDKYGDQFQEHVAEGGGAGPWNVQTWEHKKRITMVPNQNYWGPKPQLTRYEMYFYENPKTIYEAYKTGQLDTAGVPSANIAEARTTLKDQFRQDPEVSVFYYGFNELVKPFDNKKIRQAFALAVNKDLINDKVWKGARPAINNIIPKGIPGYNADLKGIDGTNSTKGNPEMAKQLFADGLKEEGYKSVTDLPKLTLPYQSGSTDVNNEVTILTSTWKSVLGVDVNLQATDFHKLLQLKFGSQNNAQGLQMAQDGWGADYPDPQDIISILFGKNAQNNYYNFGQNKTKDAADQQKIQDEIAQADASQDKTARIQLYQKIEKEIVDQAPVVMVYQRNQVHVVKPYVKGYIYNTKNQVPAQYWPNIYLTNH